VKYDNVDSIKAQIAHDPTADQRKALQQQVLLYAASSDVFFPGLDQDLKRDRPKGVDLVGARALVEKVQRSPFAAKHWPRFYAGALTTVDNDLSSMEKSLEFMINAMLGGPQKAEGAFTDVYGPLHGMPASMHLADNGFAMQPQVVLHELAHAVEAFERDAKARSADNGHGADFARTNIEIVSEFMSAQLGEELENAFNYAGVQVAPRRSV
jgi:hypothetical protein